MSLTGGFKAFSTDAREMYYKTTYLGGAYNPEDILKKNVAFFSNGKRFPKQVYYKTGAKMIRLCYPGRNVVQTHYFSRKRPELQRKGKV